MSCAGCKRRREYFLKMMALSKKRALEKFKGILSAKAEDVAEPVVENSTDDSGTKR